MRTPTPLRRASSANFHEEVANSMRVVGQEMASLACVEMHFVKLDFVETIRRKVSQASAQSNFEPSNFSDVYFAGTPRTSEEHLRNFAKLDGHIVF